MAKHLRAGEGGERRPVGAKASGLHGLVHTRAGRAAQGEKHYLESFPFQLGDQPTPKKDRRQETDLETGVLHI